MICSLCVLHNFFNHFPRKGPSYMFGKVLNITLPELVLLKTLPMFGETVRIKTFYK